MKYKAKIIDRMASPVNKKHEGHPEVLKQFLSRELESVNRNIEDIKMTMAAK